MTSSILQPGSGQIRSARFLPSTPKHVVWEDAVRQFGDVAGPLATTSDYLIPTGLDPDLDLALAYLSAAADVDGVGHHAGAL